MLLKPHSSEPTGLGPVGRLSAKHSTKHVAKVPIPVGGVNAKGQQKVQDNQGNIRFIDRKQGRVMGPSGVPIKPPKDGG